LIKTPHQGICPEGWHVPNNSEWKALFSGVDFAAQQMVGFSQWTAATDVNGFSALPVGVYQGLDYTLGWEAFFWSVSEYDYTEYTTRGQAYSWMIGSHIIGSGSANIGVVGDSGSKNYGVSVRCIQDDPVSP
jgi:uncharacterized protein (TIGR02145 family)